MPVVHPVYMWHSSSHEVLCISLNFQVLHDIKYIVFEMASLYHHKMHTAISELRTSTFVGRTVRIKSVGKWKTKGEKALFDIAIFLKMRFSSYKKKSG